MFPNASQTLHFYQVLNVKPRSHHPWFPSFRHFTTSNLPATLAGSANTHIDNFFLVALVHWVSPKPDWHQPVSQSCFVTLDLSYEGRTSGPGSLNWVSPVSMARLTGEVGGGATSSLLAYPDYRFVSTKAHFLTHVHVEFIQSHGAYKWQPHREPSGNTNIWSSFPKQNICT